MRERRRQHFNEHGEVKTTFLTKKEAKRWILDFKAHGAKRGKLYAYRCSVCGFFHVGHRHPRTLFEAIGDNLNNEQLIKRYFAGYMEFKVRPMDSRWNGKEKQKELHEILDAEMSNARVVFGAYNGALVLMMNEVIDKIKSHKNYGMKMKQMVRKVTKAFHLYESSLKYNSTMMQMKGLSEDARRYYNEDVTDADFYEYWCALGVAPFKILQTWASPLANKYRLFLTGRGVEEAETIGWLMALQDLFNFQEEIWQHIVEQMSKPHYLYPEGIAESLRCFSMDGVRKAWYQLLHYMCPAMDNIKPDAIEQKNIDQSRQQIKDYTDTAEFYFGGSIDATEDFQEIFKTKGFQEKALRQMEEAREEMSKS